MNYNH